HQTGLGQEERGARGGSQRARHGGEGSRRSAGEGEKGGRAARLAPRMSAIREEAGRQAQSMNCSVAGLYRVETWGCQMNVLDGHRMAGRLEASGYRRAEDDERADVLLLNTCAVREKAEAKVYSALGVLARQKQEQPGLVLGVTGCVAQVSGDEILERAPWVDFVMGTGDVERVGELVEKARQERQRGAVVGWPEEPPTHKFRQGPL